MPVVRQWLWLVADEPIAHRQRLLFQQLQLGFHRRTEVEKRGSVSMPSEAVLTAGSSSSLGIIFAVGFAFFLPHLKLWPSDKFELCGHGVGFQTFAHESGLLQWLQW